MNKELTSEEFEKAVKEQLNKIGIKISQCSKCGKDILFLETKNGKVMPVCLDLTSHFADCPSANDFRKNK